MEFKYYVNPDTNEYHIFDHSVTEKEIEESFRKESYTISRRDKSLIKYVKLKSGRYLKIIYRKFKNKVYFIITAFDIEDQHIIDLLDRLYTRVR